LLVATCLLPLCATACSEVKEDSGETKSKVAETESAQTEKGGEETPGASKKEAPVAASSGALAYLPESCALALHLNIASTLKNSDVRKLLLPKVEAALETAKSKSEDLALFFAATGLDPFTDFHEMSVCFGTISNEGSPTKGMAIITGSTKPGLVTALLGKTTKADKLTPVEFAGIKGMERSGFIVAQLDDGTLIAGNDKSLMEAAVAKPGGQSAAFAETGTGTLRVVVPGATVKKGFSRPKSPVAHFSEKIDGTSSLSADLHSRSMTLRIGTVDEAAANELAGVVGPRASVIWLPQSTRKRSGCLE
jgi:hypothetical protein